MGMSTLLAIQDLWALTGNVDVPGGNIINRPDVDFVIPPPSWGIEDISEEMLAKRIGAEEYPFTGMFFVQPDVLLETMLTDKPYPIKMAWMQATNPLANMGSDPKRILKAMRRLDFNVVADLFMTPTAMALADLVLPVASVLERDSIRAEVLGGWWGPIRTVNKIIQTGECKTDEEILLEVGKRVQDLPIDVRTHDCRLAIRRIARKHRFHLFKSRVDLLPKRLQSGDQLPDIEPLVLGETLPGMGQRLTDFRC